MGTNSLYMKSLKNSSHGARGDGMKRVCCGSMVMLQFLASVYDPLGVASPVSLVVKLLYHDVCDQHLPWDLKVPEKIAMQ